MPILILIAAAIALAMTRKGSGGAAAGERRWVWDPERWRRDARLRLHERRWLMWDPRVNAWASSQEMGVQPQAATNWVPATSLRTGRTYRFSGTRPSWMTLQALPGALNSAGWQVRRLWNVGNPGMPADYPVGGSPDALSDPAGYVVEALWRGAPQIMQEGIEAPVEYAAVATTGFLPDFEMGADLPPRPGEPQRHFQTALRANPLNQQPQRHYGTPFHGEPAHHEPLPHYGTVFHGGPARHEPPSIRRGPVREGAPPWRPGFAPRPEVRPHGYPPPGPMPPRPMPPRLRPPPPREPWVREPWRHHHRVSEYVVPGQDPAVVFVPGQQQQVVQVPGDTTVVPVPYAVPSDGLYADPSQDAGPQDDQQAQDGQAPPPDGGGYDPNAPPPDGGGAPDDQAPPNGGDNGQGAPMNGDGQDATGWYGAGAYHGGFHGGYGGHAMQHQRMQQRRAQMAAQRQAMMQQQALAAQMAAMQQQGGPDGGNDPSMMDPSMMDPSMTAATGRGGGGGGGRGGGGHGGHGWGGHGGWGGRGRGGGWGGWGGYWGGGWGWPAYWPYRYAYPYAYPWYPGGFSYPFYPYGGFDPYGVIVAGQGGATAPPGHLQIT